MQLRDGYIRKSEGNKVGTSAKDFDFEVVNASHLRALHVSLDHFAPLLVKYTERYARNNQHVLNNRENLWHSLLDVLLRL